MIGFFLNADLAREGVGQPLNRHVMSRLRGTFLAYSVIVLLAGIAYAAWHIHRNYRETIAATHNQLLTVATALQGEIEAMLGDGMGAVTASTNHFQHDRNITPQQIETFLQQDLTGGDYLRGLFVAMHGRFVMVERAGAVTSAQTWPSWVTCRGSDTCVVAPIRDNTLLPVMRRIQRGDEEMLIGAVYGLREIQSFYRRLDIPNSVILLIHTDGIMLSRARESDSEATPQARPQSVRASELWQKLMEQNMADGKPHIAEGVSSFSGQPVIAGTAQVPGAPLLVSVNLPRQFVLAPWWRSTAYIAAIATGVTFLLLLVALLLYRFIEVINQRERQLVKLFENARSSLMLLDNGKVKYVNGVTNQMFRVPAGQTIVGRYPWELSPERQPSGKASKEVAQTNLAAVAQGNVPVTFPWVYRRLDDSESFACEVSLSGIKLKGRDVTLAIVHDVSALMKAQEELRALNETLEQRVQERTEKLQEANERLAAINAELEEFTASASHDLRSPLGTISSQASMIELALGERARKADVVTRFEKIQMAVRRAADVIDGLLSLARITRQEILSEPIALSSMVHRVFDELKEAYPERHVDLVCEEGLCIEADPRLMKSLTQNLVGNAWKYSRDRDPARIEFGCSERRGAHVYFVKDNGVGFNMDYASKLFQAFKRLHSHDQFPGNGIGLATVARIVKRYNGEIWAVGEEGKGATFCFTLPRAEPGHVTGVWPAAAPGAKDRHFAA